MIDKNNKFKVEEQDKDQTILRSEIYKVMLELKGQKVPKSHYAKLLINKTIINLEQSNQYTDKQIEVFKNTIYQFDKIDKANNEISKFTEKEREELIKATENSAKAFSNELSNDVNML